MIPTKCPFHHKLRILFVLLLVNSMIILFVRFLYNQRFLELAHETTMTETERHIYVQTLLAFDRVWRQKLGFEYQLYGGSVLGAYRHSGFIPYDDDIDIVVPARYKETFHTFFDGTGLTIKFNQDFQQWARKVSFSDPNKSILMTHYGWRWPFLDVYFLPEKKNTLIYDGIESNVSDIYPSILIPFEGHLFPAPRCLKRYIDRKYGRGCDTTFCSPTYNHKNERWVTTSSCVPYESVKDHYSINEWKRIDDEYMERSVRKGDTRSKPAKFRRVFMPKCS